MINYQAIIFDLDGTLINSLEDIADAMNRTLLTFDYPIHPYASYNYFVGKGIKNLVSQCIPIEHRNADGIEKCLQVMMYEYGKTFAEKTKLYDGIAELLDYLTENKVKLAVLSNKAEVFTHKICDKLLNRWSFEIILGATDRFPKKPNPESALFIAKQMTVSPKNILYLGDTGIDMHTANAAGMFAVGVTWGFRSRQELEDAGAQLIIDKSKELIARLILK